MYICVYMCVSVGVYIYMCVRRYVHGSSHTGDASSQNLAFFPKTALKIKYNLLCNAPMVVFTQAEAGSSGRGNP